MTCVTRLQLLRGTTAQRLAMTPLAGELIYDTSLSKVFLGDGITPGGNVLGEDTLLTIEARNVTGGTIAKGVPVYTTGAVSGRVTIAASDNSAEATADTTIGITISEITNNNNGLVLVEGTLSGLNTSAFSDGDLLYLGTSGSITNTKPTSPDHEVFLGFCLNSSPTNGVIFVKVQTLPHLNDLHDVLLTTPSDGQLLTYDNDSGLWKNETFIIPNDELAKVSANDTTSGYLNGKLVAGTNLSFTENNDGGNETLTINNTYTSTDELVGVSSNDSTPDYLGNKLVAGTNIALTQNNDGGNETITIDNTYTSTDEFVKVSANDTTPGYLNGKLVAGSQMILTENNDAGDETLTLNPSSIDRQFTTATTTNPSMTIKQVASQTGKSLDILTSADSSVFAVDASGTIKLPLDGNYRQFIGIEGESTSGLFFLRNGTTNLQMTYVLGANSFQWTKAAFSTTLPIRLANGTAAAPQLTFDGDRDTGLYSAGANSLGVSTGGVSRIVVDASGNVGINNANPVDSLDVTGIVRVNGNGIVGDSMRYTSILRLSRDATSTASQMAFSNPNGTVGTIQTSGSTTLYNTTSDIRLKENFSPIANALDRVNSIQAVNFNFKKDKSTRVDGFIAQDLYKTEPNAVSVPENDTDEEGNINPWQVDQSKLVPLLVAAVQELTKEVEQLKKQLGAK